MPNYIIMIESTSKQEWLNNIAHLVDDGFSVRTFTESTEAATAVATDLSPTEKFTTTDMSQPWNRVWLEASCPTCHSVKGRPCVNSEGQDRWPTHEARQVRWKMHDRGMVEFG